MSARVGRADEKCLSVPPLPLELLVRRPSRLTLAATVVSLPLLLATGCGADDGGSRTENGTGVDDKSVPAPGEDGDQSDTDDQEQEG